MKGWIRDAAGVRTPLTSKGVLIGRSGSCTVILDEPSISRYHVLVLPEPDAALVLPLGRRPIELRGVPCTSVTTARHGDVLRVGRSRFEFEFEVDAPVSPWQLSVEGVRYPMTKAVFTLGSGREDDLVVSRWPPRTCALHAVGLEQTALHLELLAPCAVEGAIRQGEGYALRRGARIVRDGVTVEIVEAPPSSETMDEPTFPTEVVLEFVPEGALLRLRLRGEHTVYLPQKRADLVAALLKPPGQLPGDWVNDEVLARRVWGSRAASRNQVNVLIHRTRCSLTEAGLNGPALIERAPGGGATRFRVAAVRHVTVL